MLSNSVVLKQFLKVEYRRYFCHVILLFQNFYFCAAVFAVVIFDEAHVSTCFPKVE